MTDVDDGSVVPAAREDHITGAIRVLTADANPVVLAGLRSMLDGPQVQVVGEACSGPEALFYAVTLSPDVVVMNLVLRSLSGPKVIRAIRRLCPSTAVVVFAEFLERNQVLAARAAGASGYLVKDHSKAELLAVIKAAAGGGVSFAPRVAGLLTDHEVNKHTLTSRELQIIELATSGF